MNITDIETLTYRYTEIFFSDFNLAAKNAHNFLMCPF